MRVQHLAAAVVCAAFLEVAFLACHARSYDDVPASGDDAGDGGSGYDVAPLGDDSSNGDELFGTFDAFMGGEAGTPCTMPNGAYTETLTWEPDAGEGDSGGACQTLVPATTTFDYPPPFHANNDGSPYGCVYKVQGVLPICDFYFSCLEDDGTVTKRTTGNIDVFNGSYGGQETVELLLDDGGAQYVCAYEIHLAPQP